jgi:hypothetical protein
MQEDMNHYRRTGNVPQHVVNHFGPRANYEKIARTVDRMNSDPIRFGSTHHELGHNHAAYFPDTGIIRVSPGWHHMDDDMRSAVLAHEISHGAGTVDGFYNGPSGYKPTTDMNRHVYRPCELFR